jgi:hypothetical protein
VAGSIWLADAARVLAVLAPASDEDFEAAVRPLGLARRVPAVFTADAPSPLPADAPPPAPPAAAPPEHLPDAEPSTPSYDHDPGPEPGLPLLDPVGHENVAPTASGASTLARPAPRGATPALPHQPLLTPRSASAILRIALSRRIEGGELDVDAVVAQLARCRPIEELPRKYLRSLRFGVEVLVDRGKSMQPFARDQAELVQRIHRLVGRELTTVRSFADSPMRGCGAGSTASWQPYRPPGEGTRVLVLSDLGIGGPALNPHRAAIDDWRRFSELLRQQGCEAVALVPYPPHRWPPALTALFPLICWDRSTTSGGAFTATGGL